MNFHLDKKVALVCGASQGIGRACAVALAESGARVLLLARDRDRLEGVRRELPSPELHSIIAVDVRDRKSLEMQTRDALNKYGPISILFCNTGGPKSGLLIEAEEEALLEGFQQHVIANHLLVKLLLPGMKDLGYGRVINIISTSVKAPIPNLGVSNTIRGAAASWAKTLSLEVGRWGVTVNNVLPGYTMTGRLQSLMEKFAEVQHKTLPTLRQEWEEDVPLGRFAAPEEIAAAVAFLASPAASYIHGINLPVDGGRTPSL